MCVGIVMSDRRKVQNLMCQLVIYRKNQKEALQMISFHQSQPIEVLPTGKIEDPSYQSMSLFFHSLYTDLEGLGNNYLENRLSQYHWLNDSFELLEERFNYCETNILIDKSQKREFNFGYK